MESGEKIRSFDELLLELGDPLGRCRSLVFGALVLGVLPTFFAAINLLFTAYEPPHRCRDAVAVTDWYSNTSSPWTPMEESLDSCSEWVNPEDPALGIRKCQAGNNYQLGPKEWFVTNEFDLVCERRFYLSLGLSLQYFGIMLGNFIFGPLADLIGRRKCLFFTSLLNTLFGGAVLFATGPFSYFGCAFVQGICLQGMLLSILTTSSELFHPKYRTFQGVVIALPWPFSIFFLAFLYWQMGNWRYVQAFITCILALVTVYSWFLPESLRWLMIQGKTKAAVALVHRFAKVNGTPVRATLEADIIALTEKMTMAQEISTKNLVTSLFRTKVMRKYSLVSAVAWFTGMLLFISVNFNIPMIGGNVYISYMITGLSLCVANIFAYFILDRFGRRLPLSIAFTSGGIFVLISAVVRYFSSDPGSVLEKVAIAFSVLGVLCMTICICGLIIYSAELYPTFMRSVGMSFCGTAGRIGSTLSPQLILLGNIWQPLPMLTCAIMGLISGALILLLPETNKKSLPDSVNDVNRLNERNDIIEMT